MAHPNAFGIMYHAMCCTNPCLPLLDFTAAFYTVTWPLQLDSQCDLEPNMEEKQEISMHYR